MESFPLLRLDHLPQLSVEVLHSSLEKLPGLRKELLDSSSVYLLFAGKALGVPRLYIWVGRKSSSDDKRNAMSAASDFLEKKEMHKVTITKIGEGVETQSFKAEFDVWVKPSHKLWGDVKPKKKIEDEEIDFNSLHFHFIQFCSVMIML